MVKSTTSPTSKGATSGATTHEADMRTASEASGSISENTPKQFYGAATHGKEKLARSIGSFATILSENATMIDQRFGQKYGNYARNTAATVTELSGLIEEQDIEDTVRSTREFVRKRPVVATGGAAMIGFVVTRLLLRRRDD